MGGLFVPDRLHRWAWMLLVCAAVLVVLVVRFALASAASPPRAMGANSGPASARWVATWGASPQAPAPWTTSWHGIRNRTVREIVFTSVGGSWVRVGFTNAFGARAVRIERAAIGLPSRGAGLIARTNRQLRFGGRGSVLVRAGSQILSDPVRLAIPPLGRLAVSLFLRGATGPLTQHTDAEQVNYLAKGDHVADTGGQAFQSTTRSWYLLDNVQVAATSRTLGSVVAVGDSITDGVGSPLGANARWPNDLARRLRALGRPALGVVDEGIGGNRVLQDSSVYGPDAITRFKPDVLGQAGIRGAIVLEGLNDIGFSRSTSPLTRPHAVASARDLIAGYLQLIAAGHAAGIKVFGGTLTPFEGARYWTRAGEAEREAINRWIRHSGEFDGVIDFARAVADPRHPRALNPAYDSGDHLHLDDAGYRAMARAINLRALILELRK